MNTPNVKLILEKMFSLAGLMENAPDNVTDILKNSLLSLHNELDFELKNRYSLTKKEQELVRSKQKIAAIKSFRDRTGCQLINAKKAIEDFGIADGCMVFDQKAGYIRYKE